MANNIEIGIKVNGGDAVQKITDFENKVKSTTTAEKKLGDATKQVGDESAKASAKIKESAKATDQAGKSASKASKDMDSFAGSIKNKVGSGLQSLMGNFGPVGTKIADMASKLGWARAGWLALAAGMALAAKSAIDTADRIVDGSDALGISVGMYQKLDSELKKNGSSMDKFSSTILKIQGSIETASPAFDKLGVSIYDQNGNLRDQEAIIVDVIKALGKETDAVKRNTLAKELGGKSVRDILLLAKEWSDQKPPTLLTDDEIEKLKRAADLMDDIKQTISETISKIGATIVTPFLGRTVRENMVAEIEAMEGLAKSSGKLEDWQAVDKAKLTLKDYDEVLKKTSKENIELEKALKASALQMKKFNLQAQEARDGVRDYSAEIAISREEITAEYDVKLKANTLSDQMKASLIAERDAKIKATTATILNTKAEKENIATRALAKAQEQAYLTIMEDMSSSAEKTYKAKEAGIELIAKLKTAMETGDYSSYSEYVDLSKELLPVLRQGTAETKIQAKMLESLNAQFTKGYEFIKSSNEVTTRYQKEKLMAIRLEMNEIYGLYRARKLLTEVEVKNGVPWVKTVSLESNPISDYFQNFKTQIRDQKLQILSEYSDLFISIGDEVKKSESALYTTDIGMSYIENIKSGGSAFGSAIQPFLDNAKEQLKLFDEMNVEGASDELKRQNQAQIDKLALESKFLKDYLFQKQKASEMEIEVEKKKEEALLTADINFYAKIGSNLMNWVGQYAQAFSNLASVQRQNKAEEVDTWYSGEKAKLDSTTMTTRKRTKAEADLESQKQERMKKIKQKEKDWAIAMALINGASAVINAWTSGNWVENVIESAAITGITAIQLGTINAQNFRNSGIVGGANGATEGADTTTVGARQGELFLNGRDQRSLLTSIKNNRLGGSGGTTSFSMPITINGSADERAIDKIKSTQNDFARKIYDIVNDGIYRRQIQFA